VREQLSLVDTRLAKALSHPLRSHILAILDSRVASPREIAARLDAPLTNVSYHVRVLADLGCIELVDTAHRRGAVEHYYRAVVRPVVGEREWARLPGSVRRDISGVGLKMIWEDVSRAVEADTFDARTGRYLTRSPLALDEQGWTDLTRMLDDLLEGSDRIAAESADRLSKSGGSGVSTMLVLMHFQSAPPTADDGRPSRRRRNRSGR
jgi:DNA-binding transcriptional ArsR family regulator